MFFINQNKKLKMRLKYEKRPLISKFNSRKKPNQIKSTSIENIIISSKSKNINSGGLPQKNPNMNNTKLTMEKTYIKNNHPNLQLNNSNNNITLRNQNKEPYKNYLNTNIHGSFNSLQRKTYEILNNSYLKNYYVLRFRESH